MSATDTRPATRLPPLRQDLQLVPGLPHADGAPSWRIHDPVRNKFFELGWLEFELLSRWQAGAAIDDWCDQTAADTPLRPSREEAESLLAFLAHHQLIVPAADGVEQLRKRWLASKQAWWKQLIHNYLFFRLPLVQPDRFLSRTVAHVAVFYSMAFLWLTITAGVTGLYLATRQADALESAFTYFFSFEGLISYGIAATAAKILHELGHAYTAKRMGLRVPTMGVAFLVMWPVLYTDTGESWKLSAPSRRFAIAGAGIASELALACWTTLAWALVPDGVLRSMLFLLATTSWVLTLAINASPFMRFDGYFLLSDALDLPNLHERSSALARAAIRRRFFGLEEPDTEPTMQEGRKRALIAFAYATWLYRLILFIGIAVMVYFLFFKLLGIILMVIEIIWFIVRPVSTEVKVLLSRRSEWRLRARPWAAVLVVMAAFIWLVPFAQHANVPALARATQAATLYAPTAAQVTAVHASVGDAVTAGTLLVRLHSPELASRAERARLRAAGFAEELNRIPANSVQRERRMVIEQQLGEALADEAGALDELQRLTLVAPHDGIVRDLEPGLVQGRWLKARQEVLRVVVQDAAEVEAYVGEQSLRSVRVGQSVRFYPDLPEAPVLRGRVVAVDSSAGRAVPALLASAHGGRIAATETAPGTLVAHEALYRVRIQPDAGQPGLAAVRSGTVRIETDPWGAALHGLARVLSVIVRESGF